MCVCVCWGLVLANLCLPVHSLLTLLLIVLPAKSTNGNAVDNSYSDFHLTNKSCSCTLTGSSKTRCSMLAHSFCQSY